MGLSMIARRTAVFATTLASFLATCGEAFADDESPAAVRGDEAEAPLVADGEPESVLGVSSGDGGPAFAHAPRTAGCSAVAWSPDGHTLAVAGDELIRLWNSSTGKEVRRFAGHSRGTTAIAWSPDGRTIASGGNDDSLRLWDPLTGHELKRLHHLNKGKNFAWSPDGKMLASASDAGDAQFWDASTGEEIDRFRGRLSKVVSVAWSPDGKMLASGDHSHAVRLWDAASAQELRTFDGHAGPVDAVAWSPDGKVLASGAQDLSVRLWDIASGRELGRLSGHARSVTSLAWSPDGKMLASSAVFDGVHIWDGATGRELRVLAERRSAGAIAWSPDGTMLASVAKGDTVQLWEVTSGRELRAFEANSRGAASVAWSPNGKAVASAVYRNIIELWEAVSGRATGRLQGNLGTVQSIAWSPDGSMLASGGNERTIRVWDVATMSERRRLEGDVGSARAVAWSPKGQTLATGDSAGYVCIWDMPGGTRRYCFDVHTDSIESLAWSSTGTLLAVGAVGTIVVWDMKRESEVRRERLERLDTASVVAWRPNSFSLASFGDHDGAIWEPLGGYAVGNCAPGYDPVLGLAWTPSGQFLALADANRIRVCDTVSHSEPSIPSRWNRSVAWSPDGKTLAVGSDHDGLTTLWERQPKGFGLALAHWTGDGWAAWRAALPKEHRVLRAEPGTLVRRTNADGVLESLAPDGGRHPHLTAAVEVIRPAQPGVMGEATIAVRNAADATVAFWVELTRKPVAPGASQSAVALRLPPTRLRIEPGEIGRFSIEYISPTRENPRPRIEHLVLSLGHAHDEGKPMDVALELPFSAPRLAMAAGTPSYQGENLVVPVTLTNVGDRATGGDLGVTATFVAPDGRMADSDSQAVGHEGLAPNASTEFLWRAPRDAASAVPPVAIRLSVTEGRAPGMPERASRTGMVSTWTLESPLAKPRARWLRDAFVLPILAILGAATYWFRMRRKVGTRAA